jgi:hypothetical protein
MNGSTENRAFGASEKSGRNDNVLTLGAAAAMLPLVGRIAADVVRHRQCLDRLHPEMDRLDRDRRTLDWPQRKRRYQLQEELIATEAELRQAMAELESLGVTLLHPGSGLVGFPTVVNNRRAYFSWQPGEDGLTFWQFAGDPVRRPVPASWAKQPESRPPSRRRK